MKALVVLSFDVPTPEHIAAILLCIEPTEIPYFEGNAQVVVGKDAEDTINFLNKGD